MFQTKAIAVIISSDNTLKLVRKTEDVCFGLREKYEGDVRGGRYLMKTFYFLRNINFNGGGVIDIHRSTLFGLISVTTTYFIVYMQLN